MTKVIMWEAFVQESSDYGFNIKTAGEEENNFFFVMLQHKQCLAAIHTRFLKSIEGKKSKKFFSNELSEHRQNFNRKKVVFKAKLLWNFKFKFHKNHKMIYSRDMYPKKFSTGLHTSTGSCSWIVNIKLKKYFCLEY